MWIDTHAHLDAHEFDGAGGQIAQQALQSGVSMIVCVAVDRPSFDPVAALGNAHPNLCYTLGIHPMYVPQAVDADLLVLRARVEQALADPNFVGIGEIGLDFFIPMLTEPAMRARQEHFFREQLRIARDFALPVLMHVRRAQDQVLKHVRQIRPPSGIAHAFNGSIQQAEAFLANGMRLGFGGALTFSRALQIRRLASSLPLDAIVLETDAPDMAPSWLHPGRNSPDQLPAIGAALAELRGESIEVVRAGTSKAALAALPRMAALCAMLKSA